LTEADSSYWQRVAGFEEEAAARLVARGVDPSNPKPKPKPSRSLSLSLSLTCCLTLTLTLTLVLAQP